MVVISFNIVYFEPIAITIKKNKMSKLEKIIKNCAGIDIGSEKVFVSVDNQPVRSFRTFTASYKELGVYLQGLGITHVAMEATGIYWITLYDMLEAMKFDVCLALASEIK